MGLKAHARQYQTPFKISYEVTDMETYQQVVGQLKETELEANVVYAHSQELDIIPVGAGKANAIKYLRQQLGIHPDRVIVAGELDKEIDITYYKRIVVANANAALKQMEGDHIYHSQTAYASGVLEGLHYWKVL